MLGRRIPSALVVAASLLLGIALPARSANPPPNVTTGNGWDLYGTQKAKMSKVGSTEWEFLNVYFVLLGDGTFVGGEWDYYGNLLHVYTGFWGYVGSSGKKVELELDYDSLGVLEASLTDWAAEYDVSVDLLTVYFQKVRISWKWDRNFDEYRAKGTMKFKFAGYLPDGRLRRGSYSGKSTGYELPP